MKTLSLLTLAAALSPMLFGCSLTDQITKDDSRSGSESADREVDFDDEEDEDEDEEEDDDDFDEDEADDKKAGAAVKSNDDRRSPFLRGNTRNAKIDNGSSDTPAPIVVERKPPAPARPAVAAPEKPLGCGSH